MSIIQFAVHQDAFKNGLWQQQLMLVIAILLFKYRLWQFHRFQHFNVILFLVKYDVLKNG